MSPHTGGLFGSFLSVFVPRVFVPVCKRGGVIEAIGAGDTFCACMLTRI